MLLLPPTKRLFLFALLIAGKTQFSLTAAKEFVEEHLMSDAHQEHRIADTIENSH